MRLKFGTEGDLATPFSESRRCQELELRVLPPAQDRKGSGQASGPAHVQVTRQRGLRVADGIQVDSPLTLQQEACSGLSGGPNVITTKDFIPERGGRGGVGVTARREDAALLVRRRRKMLPAEERGREETDPPRAAGGPALPTPRLQPQNTPSAFPMATAVSGDVRAVLHRQACDHLSRPSQSGHTGSVEGTRVQSLLCLAGGSRGHVTRTSAGRVGAGLRDRQGRQRRPAGRRWFGKAHVIKWSIHFKWVDEYLQNILTLPFWLTKPKILTIWPFTEKVCRPLISHKQTETLMKQK